MGELGMGDLKLISDFDFGIGGDLTQVVRVAKAPVPLVNKDEEQMIIWILLEWNLQNRETKEAKAEEEADTTDARIRRKRTQIDPYKRSRVLDTGIDKYESDGFRKTRTKYISAQKYSEELLRSVGVDVPFESLSTEERQRLFHLFSASSNLLREEKISNIYDLYEAIRRRSKFKEDFFVRRELGSGAYGEVFEVMDLRKDYYGGIYAIKRISMVFEAMEDIRMGLNEAAALRQLSGNPNIVAHFDSWVELNREFESEKLNFYIQMETCSSTLAKWHEENLVNRKTPSPSLLIKMVRMILSGLKAIHAAGFIHLDLNPNNVFLNENVLKIGDFGLAVKRDSFDTSIEGETGTLPYSAPEIIQTQKSDMYSLGVILLEINFRISTKSELFTRIQSKDFATNDYLLDIVLKYLLNRDDKKRPSADSLDNFLAGSEFLSQNTPHNRSQLIENEKMFLMNSQ